MRRALLILTAIATLVSGCANSSGARMGLFTTTTPILAIVAGEIYTGESVSYIDGSGTIRLRASSHRERQCDGEFRSESQVVGVGSIHCTDGTQTLFQFRALSTLTGYGFGRAATGEVRFTYGLTPEQAQPYLNPPPGKKLQRTAEGFLLIDG
jgi:hypothetical protein